MYAPPPRGYVNNSIRLIDSGISEMAMRRRASFGQKLPSLTETSSFSYFAPMSSNISLTELKRAVALREQIESLQNKLDRILAGEPAAGKVGRPRKGMSAAGRRKIGLTQKKRWAKIRKPKRTMSAAARARISVAAKLRWKKAKAAGRTSL